MIRFMVGTLRDVWMCRCRIKEKNNGGGGAKLAFYLKVVVGNSTIFIVWASIVGFNQQIWYH